MNVLQRVRSGLLRHPLDGQVLVYDPRTHATHLLDPTTACVLDLLDEGGWTSEGIHEELKTRLKIGNSEGLLELALAQLDEAGLIETKGSSRYSATVDRRELLRKVAAVGVASLLIPAITTLTPTPGYAQGSPGGGGGTLAACQPCTNSAQCASPNTCVSGSGGDRCSGGTNPTGLLSGQAGSVDNPVDNCGGAGASTRQAAANAACCSGSATVTGCSGGSTGTVDFTCA